MVVTDDGCYERREEAGAVASGYLWCISLLIVVLIVIVMGRLFLSQF